MFIYYVSDLKMSASGLISDICPICKEAFADTDDTVKIGQKGADGTMQQVLCKKTALL